MVCIIIIFIILKYTGFAKILISCLQYVMFPCRMCDEINLIFHHKGKLERNAYMALEYVDGEYCIWEMFIPTEFHEFYSHTWVVLSPGYEEVKYGIYLCFLFCSL